MESNLPVLPAIRHQIVENNCELYEGTSNSSTQPSEIIVYEESISTNDEYLDEAISSPENHMTVEVVNCEDVQIGSTINIHGPSVVTDNSWQNLSNLSSSASIQVNVYDGSKVQTGPRVSYNSLVNVTNVVEANAVKFDETQRLAIEDEMQLQRDISDDSTITTAVNYVNRTMWHARPPKQITEHLQHTVPYVVLLHTVTEECLTLEECVLLIRHTQKYHMDSKDWDDIAYNFLIGGDGNVYEGRGWEDVGSFAGTENNRMSIGIGVIGNFMEVLPSSRQLRAIEFCIQEGVRLGKISRDYKILLHCQLRDTQSPGDKFVELIKTWPRWSRTPCRDNY